MSTNAVLMAKDSAMIDYVYSSAAMEWLLANTNIHPETVTADNLDSELPKLSQTEVIFSTWGIPRLNEQQIAAMPKLKAVFYAAGSVRAFAEPFLEREIMICSAVEANAIPVAEFCLGQILLSLKGYFINNRVAKSGQWSDAIKVVGPGVYGETVALLGVGSISRHLLKLLKNFNIRVIAVSNYLQSRPEEASLLGIERLV
ncbi:MAG: NAD(P)-dependent oxidoreductase, partial [Victivallaceae bacterium]